MALEIQLLQVLVSRRARHQWCVRVKGASHRMAFNGRRPEEGTHLYFRSSATNYFAYSQLAAACVAIVRRKVHWKAATSSLFNIHPLAQSRGVLATGLAQY